MMISEKIREKYEQLIMENVDKIELTEITRILSPIDLDSKYI